MFFAFQLCLVLLAASTCAGFTKIDNCTSIAVSPPDDQSCDGTILTDAVELRGPAALEAASAIGSVEGWDESVSLDGDGEAVVRWTARSDAAKRAESSQFNLRMPADTDLDELSVDVIQRCIVESGTTITGWAVPAADFTVTGSEEDVCGAEAGPEMQTAGPPGRRLTQAEIDERAAGVPGRRLTQGAYSPVIIIIDDGVVVIIIIYFR